jgi:UDP-N-acetylmuramoyl-tripeptide--D-alanyl-D-alanine ligase
MDRALEFLDVQRAASLAACELLGVEERKERIHIEGVAVDSRKCERGDLFIALKGERTDGHRYLKDAVSRGAAAVMVDRSFYRSTEGGALINELGVPILVAENGLKSLQRLAKSRVQDFTDVRRIAVTGSNGKTTTKELIASVLSSTGRTVKNPGNLNSEIGLPQALLSVRAEHRYGVFELGINHPGEMDLLTDIYRPQFTVITTIGTAHIGLFGSREAIAREKAKALEALPGDGRAFIPADSEWAEYLEALSPAPVEKYGERSTRGVESVETRGLKGWRIRYEGTEIALPLPGRHNLSNALAAIHVGRHFEVDAEGIRTGIEAVSLPEGRSRLHTGPVSIFEDSYNANLDSMKPVIDELARDVEPGGLVLVLGAMKELGGEAENAHRELAETVFRSGAKAAFLLGEEMKWTEESLKSLGFPGLLFMSEDFSELETALVDYLEGGETVLLKGSRLMELERLVEPIKHIVPASAAGRKA